MTKIANAPITITTQISSDGCTAKIEGSGESVTCTNRALTPTKLGEQRQLFYSELDRFRKASRNARPRRKWKMTVKAVCSLHKAGRLFAYDLFGGDVRSVQKLVQKASPGWENGEGILPEFVVISRGGETVPIEFLPLFDFRDPVEHITDVASLYRALRCFPGYSACVHRVTNSIGQDDLPHDGPELPLKFYQHAGLNGVRREIEFFHNRSAVALNGPWPERATACNEMKEELASCLLFSSRTAGPLTNRPPVQVRHFGCHAGQEHILLSHCNKGQAKHDRRITIGDLKAELTSKRSTINGPKWRRGPLVFVNSCASARMDPTDIDSWSDLFLGEGSRGFIGAETPIPDHVAAEFSKTFYSELLKGKPLGVAVHEAKWKLVEQHKNLLGILYTVYANPRTRLMMTPNGDQEP